MQPLPTFSAILWTIYLLFVSFYSEKNLEIINYLKNFFEFVLCGCVLNNLYQWIFFAFHILRQFRNFYCAGSFRLPQASSSLFSGDIKKTFSLAKQEYREVVFRICGLDQGSTWSRFSVYRVTKLCYPISCVFDEGERTWILIGGGMWTGGWVCRARLADMRTERMSQMVSNLLRVENSRTCVSLFWLFVRVKFSAFIFFQLFSYIHRKST